MIVALKHGGQLIIGECPWLREGGIYLAVGNMRGSQGAIATPAEIDQAIGELTRIRALIDERQAEKQRKQDNNDAIASDDRQRRCA